MASVRPKARQIGPPGEIFLAYRVLGATHLFTASGFQGFSVGSSSLQTAFEQLAKALSEHVSLVCGEEAEYQLEMSFADFWRHLLGNDDADIIASNFVVAKKSVDHLKSVGRMRAAR